MTALNILAFCFWRDDSCHGYFTDTITDEGICHTFNALDASELFSDEIATDFKKMSLNTSATHWTIQDGYSSDADPETFPKRVFGAGSRAGLHVVLELDDIDADYVCRGSVQGFKVILHAPNELPTASKNFFRVPLRQEVVVSVKPNMITTSPGLEKYDPYRRMCFFDGERHLRFFKTYTQNNCELECLANFTLEQCGCVKFSMPHDNDAKICGRQDILCYDDAEYDLIAEIFKKSLNFNNSINGSKLADCNCLPACTSINYDAETSQSEYDFEKEFNARLGPSGLFQNKSTAQLKIFFKEAQFMTSRRSELYGLTDFISNCGGLLGLFMGVSILSLVEIVYYFTLRVACNMNCKSNKVFTIEKQDGSENLSNLKIVRSLDELESVIVSQ